MEEVWKGFRSRCYEIERYLVALRFIENVDVPQLVSRGLDKRFELDLPTQHVLKASVYLHLYNLVESTVTACLRCLAEEVQQCGMPYRELTDELRSVWLRGQAKIDQEMNPENRLKALISICEELTASNVVELQPKIPGNLDDREIEKLIKRYGLRFVLRTDVKNAVKRPIVNDNGPLVVIRHRRNELAHGLVSFAECGRDTLVRDLRKWRVLVVRYLRGLIRCFEGYLNAREFKRPNDAKADRASQ